MGGCAFGVHFSLNGPLCSPTKFYSFSLGVPPNGAGARPTAPLVRLFFFLSRLVDFSHASVDKVSDDLRQDERDVSIADEVIDGP